MSSTHTSDLSPRSDAHDITCMLRLATARTTSAEDREKLIRYSREVMATRPTVSWQKVLPAPLYQLVQRSQS